MQRHICGKFILWREKSEKLIKGDYISLIIMETNPQRASTRFKACQSFIGWAGQVTQMGLDHAMDVSSISARI